MVDRWEFSHGRIGVNAPSWLTFEVHRPYFDGGSSALTAIQARAPLVAARLVELDRPLALRCSMVMPASYRELLVEESRLAAYRIRRPTDLATDLASPAWRRLADAFRHRGDLRASERAGLAQWLVACCLPEAVLDLAPDDLPSEAADEGLAAVVQYARAMALFQLEGLSPRTTAAFRCLLAAPRPTIGHLHAAAAWGYLTARHAADAADAARHAELARVLFEELARGLTPFERALWEARLLVRETMHAERDQAFDRGWTLLESASAACAGAAPDTAEEEAILLEMKRRILDRQVEMAVRRDDRAAEARLVEQGLALDPYCVKIRMQAAQAAERRDDVEAALAGYLVASRLGPYGTAFALIRAAACARRLDRPELARVLEERAFRAAPRSEQTRTALLAACEAAGDAPLAEVVRRTAPRPGARAYESNWHYQMYGAYFNLALSRSPCFYARIPLIAYEFAVAGHYPRVDLQRIMPPAFRTNLVRESGLGVFAVRHPAELPKPFRTPEWEQLCEWVDGFERADLNRQYLTMLVLFRIGFHQLVLDRVPERPVATLSAPLEFYHHHWRDIVRYVHSVGRALVPPHATFEMAADPRCPLHLRLCAAVFGVVFSARETKSLEAADRWRRQAEEHLADMLRSDDFTPFEKVMLESRFYRGVSFVPFMKKDRAALIRDMDRAEQCARAVPAESVWEQYLKQENLHACLESRSKEAFGLGDTALGHQRTEEFLAIDPYDPKTHIERGESLLKQQRHREAGESYLRAARLGPIGTALAYSMAGECFEHAGDSIAAEDCFTQALRVDPYAVSAARGWARVAVPGALGPLAAEYANALEAWGAARRARRPA